MLAALRLLRVLPALRALLRILWEPVIAVLGILGFFGLLPAPMQLEWLRRLAKHMGPHHPNLHEVLLEILDLEERCDA